MSDSDEDTFIRIAVSTYFDDLVHQYLADDRSGLALADTVSNAT